ncbi:ERV/ALR sulfhydryl oxidase domain-containing protein [Immersiella caudata]|uniref:Sulfhydryl oxidase n=1 Tax=Immersiella caudata TaxID=314043 RepID=A0AA39U4Z2_9PEZI|nr:ERV/ALR sulfhydryl oxidase domain-containing protein [Immersiella caudata]
MGVEEPAPNAGAPTSETSKKYPKGVILGKDGKPCRSCNSFSAFTSQSRLLMPPKDCPPDSPQLGRATWTLLHSIAASYPSSPTPTQQSEITQFMSLFSKLYPCWVCAEDFQKYMAKDKVRVGSRDEFGKWLCEAHNEVNRKLGKKEFDCGLWEERWRTGRKDGRCD